MSKFRDFEKYEVYEDGRIFSYYTNKFLKPQTEKNGYKRVNLYDNKGKIKRYSVHRIVYEAVTGEPIPNGLQVNHIDENKENNAFGNLNLMTPKENTNYGTGIARRAKEISKALKGIIPKAKPTKQVGAFQNGQLILTFPSTAEAGRNGFKQSHIVSCCNGKRKTHKGYEWKYLKEKET